ncbi:hypothetical protein ONE63_004818 [Megalurothrips usitatus]|uniref:Uncharacterized protein n=1 Tax=Megalurothrips usitatus TaxID=439358 RepID=A0AAV7X0W2_9NEOP|nr:hypothetical protein ONE63_004818 [Megalurothrips usitatus]
MSRPCVPCRQVAKPPYLLGSASVCRQPRPLDVNLQLSGSASSSCRHAEGGDCGGDCDGDDCTSSSSSSAAACAAAAAAS